MTATSRQQGLCHGDTSEQCVDGKEFFEKGCRRNYLALHGTAIMKCLLFVIIIIIILHVCQN